MKNRQGSMTIFATLSFMLIAAFLFTLLEVARMSELQKIAKMNTESVVESVFANYEIALWEQYHLLAFSDYGNDMDECFSEIESTMQVLSNENMEPVALNDKLIGKNYLQMQTVDVNTDKYLLITDQNGKVFQAEVASYMESNLALEAARMIYEQFQTMKDISESNQLENQAIDQALDAMQEAKDSTSSGNASGQEDTSLQGHDYAKSSQQVTENPLEVTKKAQTKGILKILLEDDAELSDEKVELKNLVSHRTLEKGNDNVRMEFDWLSDVMLQQYLIQNFSDYTNPAKNHGLQYELEYLICGKSSDVDNLKQTANDLLGIREAANFMYLLSDSVKKEEAEVVALALAGESCNEAVLEVVKIGILAAWAYAESVLDVRALLQGKKISILKSSGEWTSSIFKLSEVFSKSTTAKDCPEGLNYSTYLGSLLLLKSNRTLSYRAMDMQECTIRKIEGYEDFKMDHMVIDASFAFEYRYHTIFMGMESLTQDKTNYFSICNQYGYSYRKAGV